MAPETTGELRLPIEVRCTDLPGRRFHDNRGGRDRVYEPVWLGLQKGKAGESWCPGDADAAVFQPHFRVRRHDDGSANFLGPYAQGKPDDRFFYLVWAVRRDGGATEMFRRLKIRLGHITWRRAEEAARGRPLRVDLSLTDEHREPLCATPPAELVRWS